MSEEVKFSHITVTADDDDDVVIEAGASKEEVTSPVRVVRSAERPLEPASRSTSSHPQDTPEELQESPVNPKKDTYRETTLEDLQGTKMSTMQKAIIALAVVALIAFVVWYIVL